MRGDLSGSWRIMLIRTGVPTRRGSGTNPSGAGRSYRDRFCSPSSLRPGITGGRWSVRYFHGAEDVALEKGAPLPRPDRRGPVRSDYPVENRGVIELKGRHPDTVATVATGKRAMDRRGSIEKADLRKLLAQRKIVLRGRLPWVKRSGPTGGPSPDFTQTVCVKKIALWQRLRQGKRRWTRCWSMPGIV